MAQVHTGGCACGAVRYELLGDDLDVADCHCRMCQRAVGAGFVPWATVALARLRVVGGAPRWWRSSATAERGFCDRCGTSLFFRPLSGEPFIDVTVASLDAPAVARPRYAIWTERRQPWIHLDPALPAYPGAGPDWTPAPPVAPHGPATDLDLRDGPDVDVIQLGALFAAVGFSRSPDPGGLSAMLAGSRWIVSAWRGPELVGFCRAVSDGVSNAYLTSVAVRPALQRQGIGRAMLLRLLDGRPAVKFILHTSPAGRQLYRSVGFQDGADYMVRPRLNEG